MHILIADDDPTSLLIMKAMLTGWGHSVATAQDGQEAYEILCRETISFVISDWNMPYLEGPELCRRIRASDLPHYVYFILLTVRGDRASLIEGMEAGADDFLVKPVDRGELRVRVRAGERVINLEQQLEERNNKLHALNQDLQQAYDTIRKDVEAAAALQLALLPSPTALEGVNFDWLFRPSHFVAGDMFGFFLLIDRCLAFYHLDVAGHGIPSALLSFTLSHILSQGREGTGFLLDTRDGTTRPDATSPHRVVAELNRRFAAEMDSSLYFTMLYGVLDTQTGRVALTQAGHPSPLWLHQSDKKVSVVGTGGFPIGLLPDCEYETTNLELAEGDRLFLYSDGIPDCENAAGEPFSQSRLIAILEDHAAEPLHVVTRTLGSALHTWKGDEHYQDDVSLLALEYRTIRPG